MAVVKRRTVGYPKNLMKKAGYTVIQRKLENKRIFSVFFWSWKFVNAGRQNVNCKCKRNDQRKIPLERQDSNNAWSERRYSRMLYLFLRGRHTSRNARSVPLKKRHWNFFNASKLKKYKQEGKKVIKWKKQNQEP